MRLFLPGFSRYSVRRSFAFTLALAAASAGVSASASVYKWTYTGSVASRQILNDDADQSMRTMLNSVFPNATRFVVSFEVDTAKATFHANSANNGFYLNQSPYDSFMAAGSLWIGTDSSTIYQASFSSLATSNGVGENIHYSFQMRDNENTGGPGNPNYVDGITIGFYDDAIVAPVINGEFFLSGISLTMHSADSATPSALLSGFSIPTSIDATQYAYNQAGVIFSFENAEGTQLGNVRGGLGGEPGEFWNPANPSWGVIPQNTFTIAPAVPEPSAYAIGAAFAALAVVAARRQRQVAKR